MGIDHSELLCGTAGHIHGSHPGGGYFPILANQQGISPAAY
jgi:hypothetical protein